MAVQFCNPCGNLLDISANRKIKCDNCGTVNNNELLRTTTITSSNNFPSQLRQKRSVTQQIRPQAATDSWSTTQERCRKCGTDEVRYTSLQLRSADEGTTLFYFCPKCSERWNEDN